MNREPLDLLTDEDLASASVGAMDFEVFQVVPPRS